MDQVTLENIKDFDIPNPFRSRCIVDSELCTGIDGLKEVIHKINCSNYQFLGATQNAEIYTVFFRRPAV